MIKEKDLQRLVRVMRINKYWLIILSVLLSCVSYFLLRAPEYKNALEFLGFFDENHHFIPLRISRFSSGNIPEIEMQIEDKTIPSKVDLGWEGGVVLPVGMIDTLKNKSFLKKKAFFGIRGKSYESNIYELPNIRIGKMKFFSMWAEEESDAFVRDGVLKKGEREGLEEPLGRIGWCLFKSFNLLLDCDHCVMVMCDSLATARQQGYFVDAFVEAPLLLDRGTIDFEVMTEAGLLRCMLDTGSTWNILNKDLSNLGQEYGLIDLDHLNGKPPEFNPTNEDLLVFNPEDEWKTKIFQISGIEFGPLDFVKIQSPLGLDAIIGMEFIDNHLIFIDFRNEKIYFSKLPEERSLFKRAYDSIQTKLYRN